jgi:hypothetical protein
LAALVPVKFRELLRDRTSATSDLRVVPRGLRELLRGIRTGCLPSASIPEDIADVAGHHQTGAGH